MQMSLFPMSGREDSRAKMSLLREWAHERGLKGRNLDSFMSLCDSLERVAPELFSSRTFQACCLAMGGETSESSFGRWPNSGMVWDGVCLTAGTSECHSHVKESTLLDAIETGEAPQRYFLSPNAARGMLRRANRMGRPLFPPLRKALEILEKDR